MRLKNIGSIPDSDRLFLPDWDINFVKKEFLHSLRSKRNILSKCGFQIICALLFLILIETVHTVIPAKQSTKPIKVRGGGDLLRRVPLQSIPFLSGKLGVQERVRNSEGCSSSSSAAAVDLRIILMELSTSVRMHTGHERMQVVRKDVNAPLTWHG
ncbi:hypothetical protein TNCT_180371 [Trichonephila clavata]|uniref:Uncharacterized protein n=1 Tax=Trichonephila clavata TaxID=2740835 RepID=A0A8X6GL42_TRICU|nr:hypothetical protein TNCT_180371 [Trichonephila clavata]